MASHQHPHKEVDTSEEVETALPTIEWPRASESWPLRNW